MAKPQVHMPKGIHQTRHAKKQLFDVVNYMKVCFATTQSVDRDEDKPKTRQAFDRYCEQEHGLELCEI